jgi:hypothetical protein
MSRTVAVVTLGCARNEVDSEELAGRLAADGWILVDDVEKAEVALINTCGFIESAKKDSVDALLEANSLKGHGFTRAVVAVGCMAERYGQELAEALPEADAPVIDVLGAEAVPAKPPAETPLSVKLIVFIPPKAPVATTPVSAVVTLLGAMTAVRLPALPLALTPISGGATEVLTKLPAESNRLKDSPLTLNT